MLSEKMVNALNEQINKEIYSAYLYMSMSAYSTYIGLKGFANWFMVQYQEEMAHAMKIYDYVNDQGAQVKLMAIEKPPTEFG
ncbi:ferritin, partial [Thermococci archaeon]